jgi:small-conductance mechanosensitive channel
MSLSEILQQSVLNNAVADWLRAVVIFLVVAAGLALLRRVVIHRVAKLARLTSTDYDDVLVDVLSRTRLLFIIGVALVSAHATLPNGPLAYESVRTFTWIIVFVQAVIWANALIGAIVAGLNARRPVEDQANVAVMRALGTAARFVVFAALFLVALEGVGVKVTPLITGLGIGGIAIALAVQNILADLFGAVSILVDKPFTVGDFVVVDDLKGTIEHVGLKSTRVRSLGGEQIVFSNADLLQSRVRNFKRMLERRVAFTTGVTYQTPKAKLERIPAMIREIVEAQSQVRFERCHFLKFADSWLEFETIYWVLSPEYIVYADIHQAVNLALFQRFEDEKIEFAYPTKTLFVSQAAEDSAPTKVT